MLWLLFIIPIIFFGLFIIISNTRWFKKIDKLTIRRIYYLSCLIWASIFIYLFFGDITCLTFSNQNTNIKTKTVVNDFNIVWCIIILFIVFVVWDFLFVSCRTITDLSFKDFNIKTEEYKEFEKTTISKTEDLDILTKALEIEYRIIAEMKDYLTSIPELGGFDDYKYLIKKYEKMRGNIKIECYQYETEGINKYKNLHRLNSIEYSTIRYCLDTYYVCTPESKNGKDELIALIKTKFSNYDIIVVMYGSKVMPSEHIIIQHIISYFDRLIDIDILNTRIDNNV